MATHPANSAYFFGVSSLRTSGDFDETVHHAAEATTATVIGKRAAEHFQHMLSGLENGALPTSQIGVQKQKRRLWEGHQMMISPPSIQRLPTCLRIVF